MSKRPSRNVLVNSAWSVLDIVAGLVAGFVVWWLLVLPLLLTLAWSAYLVAAIVQLIGVVCYCVARRDRVRHSSVAKRFLTAFVSSPIVVAIIMMVPATN